MKNLTRQQKIDNLLKEVSTLVPAGDGYHYEVEFASVYGGYRLVKVNNKSGGHSGCFGGNGCENRIKFAEMINKLQTIIETANSLIPA
jgi:hypothetical protein